MKPMQIFKGIFKLWLFFLMLILAIGVVISLRYWKTPDLELILFCMVMSIPATFGVLSYTIISSKLPDTEKESALKKFFGVVLFLLGSLIYLIFAPLLFDMIGFIFMLFGSGLLIGNRKVALLMQ